MNDVNRSAGPDVPSDEGLLELLASADTAWTTAQGVCRHWRRHDLVLVAFDRHFARLEAGGRPVWSAPSAAEERVAEPEVTETVRWVAIDRVRSRVRAERLSAPGPEVVPDVLVIDGDHFWARTGTDVATNNGDPGHAHGGTEAVALLEPGYVPSLFDLTPTGMSTVSERQCATVRATARHAAEEVPLQYNPFGMVIGGEEFLLDVDRATALIVRATKLVDGLRAEVQEWLELRMDGLLEEALFAPLTANS
jgi:hypothetical protein